MTWLRRKSDRLRPLDEAAAYARCHGDREDSSVRIVKLPPRRAHYDTVLATGEDIRRSLEARIDGCHPIDEQPHRRSVSRVGGEWR